VLIIIAGRDAEIIKVSVQDVNSPCRPHPPPDLIEKEGESGKNMDRRDFAQIAPQNHTYTRNSHNLAEILMRKPAKYFAINSGHA